jgi:hypothetical protein
MPVMQQLKFPGIFLILNTRDGAAILSLHARQFITVDRVGVYHFIQFENPE